MRSPLWLVPPLVLAATLACAQNTQAPADLRYASVQVSRQGGWRSSDAKVEAVREAQLAAQVAGSIVALPVQVGDAVKAGQELARIDARMASQGAAASQAQVAAAQAQLQVAAKEYERQQQLFVKRYVSQAALDSAQAQWRAASAQVTALQAQAGVASTQAGLHRIAAPYAGVVASVPVQLGDMALPGRPLLTLYDPAQLRLAAQVSTSQAAELRQGVPVQVEIHGVRTDVAAKLVELLPTADPQSHTVTLRVALPAGVKTQPGAFARLWWQGMDAGGGAARLSVPTSSVLRRAEMTGVYVKGQNGQPQLRQVRLGPTSGDQVEVLSGLRAGDLVATQPQAAAKNAKQGG